MLELQIVLLLSILAVAISIGLVNVSGEDFGLQPLVLAFSKSGELMVVANGTETKAPQKICVQQWQEVHFLYNARHSAFKIDRVAAEDLFLHYLRTEQRREDTVELYEAYNYGTTFYLHVDVKTDGGTQTKRIPFEVEPDTALAYNWPL